MLVLLETPAGYALFKVLSEKKLRKVEDIWEHFETQEAAQKVVSLVSLSKFKNTKDALLCIQRNQILSKSKPEPTIKRAILLPFLRYLPRLKRRAISKKPSEKNHFNKKPNKLKNRQSKKKKLKRTNDKKKIINIVNQ